MTTPLVWNSIKPSPCLYPACGSLGAARKTATDVLAGVGGTGVEAKKVHDSYMAFRDSTAEWSRISIKGVLEAREG